MLMLCVKAWHTTEKKELMWGEKVDCPVHLEGFIIIPLIYCQNQDQIFCLCSKVLPEKLSKAQIRYCQHEGRVAKLH